MRPEFLGGVIVPRKLGFGQGRVDLVMANLMQAHDRATFAAFELGHKMVKALTGLGRNGPPAQGTNRVLRVAHLITGHLAGMSVR